MIDARLQPGEVFATCADCTALRDLLAIVDIDAAPILATLSLLQHEFPEALEVCGGVFLSAQFRVAAAFKVELVYFGAKLASRDVNRKALRKQGIAGTLVEAFIGSSAIAQYPGESDPFVQVLRIDWPSASALLNASTLSCLLTAPDHFLIKLRLPEARLILPQTPEVEISKPNFLRVKEAMDLPRKLDGSSLRSLEIASHINLDGLREALLEARGLRRLVIGQSNLLEGGLFDELSLPELETLELEVGAAFGAQGWNRLLQWPSIRILRLHGLETRSEGHLEILQLLAAAPFWEQLTHLNLRISARWEPLDAALWGELWSGRRFALETLQLSYLTPERMSQVWRGHFGSLKTLDVSDNNFKAELGNALAGADLPLLETLDIRGNSVQGDALRELVTTRRFAALKRVAIRLYGDETEDYCDWNGAVVGNGSVHLTDREIEKLWLAGTGVCVFDGVDGYR